MKRWQLYSNRQVAWKLIDGATMAGHVISTAFYPTVSVRRVDGTECQLQADRLRAAKAQDVLDACALYQPPIGPKEVA